jgi:hypothetical protein
MQSGLKMMNVFSIYERPNVDAAGLLESPELQGYAWEGDIRNGEEVSGGKRDQPQMDMNEAWIDPTAPMRHG